MTMQNDAAPATQGDIKKLTIEIVKTHGRIEDLKDAMNARLDQMNFNIIGKLDGFMAQAMKVDRAEIITSYRVDELEKRVKTLETGKQA